MFQFINRSKNWVVTIVLAIIIGLTVPSLIALASSVIGDNMVITNLTEQLRLGYNASIYTSITTDASSSLSIIPNGSAGGWKIIKDIDSPIFISGYSGNQMTGSDTEGSAILSGGHLLPDPPFDLYGPNVIENNTYSVISGGEGNSITSVGGFFSGVSNFIGSGAGNIIEKGGAYSVIVGGDRNKLTSSVTYPYLDFIGGGAGNIIDSHNNSRNVIVGGSGNLIYGNGHAAIVGGQTNTAWHYSFVGGGAQNTAGATDGDYSTVAGGRINNASGHDAMILGGLNNTASGTAAFASGRRAKATHNGSFIWADYSNFDFTSTATNETAFRSTGGVRFVTAIDGSGNATRTAQFATTGDLNLNGGIKLNTVTAKPACSSTYRGMFWVTQSAAGVKDVVEVCAKDAGDAYAWRSIY